MGAVLCIVVSSSHAAGRGLLISLHMCPFVGSEWRVHDV